MSRPSTAPRWTSGIGPAAQRSVADVFPAVGRADRMLARRYDWLAGRLRLRPAGRQLALIILEWVALAALLAGAYLGASAIAGRDGAAWLVAATAAAFSATIVVTVARHRYGSGWLAPVHPWRDEAVAAAGIPIALLAPGHLDAGVVDALGWTVCFFVALMLLAGVVWYHRPRALAVAAAWLAAAGVAMAAGAPVVLVAAVVGVLHSQGKGTL